MKIEQLKIGKLYRHVDYPGVEYLACATNMHGDAWEKPFLVIVKSVRAHIATWGNGARPGARVLDLATQGAWMKGLRCTR